MKKIIKFNCTSTEIRSFYVFECVFSKSTKIITYIRDKKRRNQEHRQCKTEAEIHRCRRNADTDHDLFVCDTFNIGNRREFRTEIKLHSC